MEKTGKTEEWEMEHWGETVDGEDPLSCGGDGKEAKDQADREISLFEAQYENARSAWTDACLFWYDIWCESHPEPIVDVGISDGNESSLQNAELLKMDDSEQLA